MASGRDDEVVSLEAASSDPWDRNAHEPRLKEILDRTVEWRSRGPYIPRNDEQIMEMLENYFVQKGFKDVAVSGVRRMSGGASKEQFAFHITHADLPEGERLILRMDPLECIAQTCRGREAQLQTAAGQVLPVATVRFVDADAEIMDQPASILEFVHGVTEPSDNDTKGVSGMGTRFDAWAAKLAPQFVDAFVKTHGLDWRQADLSLFAIPRDGTTDAALWQVNYWTELYRNAIVEPIPVITLCERWLRENLPVGGEPVIVHSDLRIRELHVRGAQRQVHRRARLGTGASRRLSRGYRLGHPASFRQLERRRPISRLRTADPRGVHLRI